MVIKTLKSHNNLHVEVTIGTNSFTSCRELMWGKLIAHKISKSRPCVTDRKLCRRLNVISRKQIFRVFHTFKFKIVTRRILQEHRFLLARHSFESGMGWNYEIDFMGSEVFHELVKLVVIWTVKQCILWKIELFNIYNVVYATVSHSHNNTNSCVWINNKRTHITLNIH